MKNILQIWEYINIVNGWEITKFFLAKQNSSWNETNINNNRVNKISFYIT